MKRKTKGRWGGALLATALTLSGCGGADREDILPPLRSDPFDAPSPSIPGSGAPRGAALLAIARDQDRALTAYRTVRGAQEEIYYASVAAIEEELRRGAPAGSPALTRRWQTAAQALRKLGQALVQLENIIAVRPDIEKAQALDIPAATTLLGQLDSAQDELRRQQGLMIFENRKMAALRQAIADGLETPAPLAPPEEALGDDAGDTAATRERPAPATEATPKTAAPERVQAEAPNETPPLAVIRFNRPNVVFRAQLQDAIERAKSLTPTGRIHLVAVAPHVKSAQEQLLVQAESYQYAQSILRAVEALGVPAEQVRLTTRTSQAAVSSEVHIYAGE